MFLYIRFPRADARFDTTFPRLFLMSMSRVRPPTVFSLLPRNTKDLAKRPRAILLTRFAFIAFIAFTVFIALLRAVAFFITARAMAAEICGFRARDRPARRAS